MLNSTEHCYNISYLGHFSYCAFIFIVFLMCMFTELLFKSHYTVCNDKEGFLLCPDMHVCGRKLEYPEKTHASTGRTCKRAPLLGFEHMNVIRERC